MKDFDTNGRITIKYEKAKASRYCSFCGRPLIYSSLDEEGNKTDPQWERENGVHYGCFVSWRDKEQMKLEKAEAAKIPEEISEDALAKYADKLKQSTEKPNTAEQ